MAGREQPVLDAVRPLLLREKLAQPVPQFRARHLALKLRPPQHRGQKPVLIQQHVLVERHIGDANGAFVAQRAVVAPDGHFENRPSRCASRLRCPS